MRFVEFRTTLLESAINKEISTSTMVYDLQSLANLADQIPPEDEKIADKILANLQQTRQQVTAELSSIGITMPSAAELPAPDAVAEPAPAAAPVEPTAAPVAPVEPTAEPVAEPAPTEEPVAEPAPEEEEEQLAEAVAPTSSTAAEIKQNAEEMIAEINFILSLPITKAFPHPRKMKMVATMEKSIQFNKALIRQVKMLSGKLKASEAEKEIAKNFLREVNGLLEKLGDKVQNFNETSIEHKAGLGSKERTQLAKKEFNAKAFTNNLKHFMFGLIIDITLKPEIHQTNEEEIRQFLKACVAGDVINMTSLISQTNGNVESHVNEEYMKLFTIFKTQKIFSYNPGKTSGAIGPGEMALSMMGSPVRKAEQKGDLIVGDKEIEVKAGSSSGGRLNSKKITKPGPAWKEAWTPGIERILKAIPKGTPIRMKNSETGQVVAVPKEEFHPNIKNYKKNEDGSKGSAKIGARYNFNQQGLNALNTDLLTPFSTRELTTSLFWETFNKIILNLDEVEESLGQTAAELIDAAIPDDGGRDGGIDVDAIISAYTKLAYESYHLADGITTIMYLNTESLDYALIEDGEDLVSRIGKDIKITGGFNFNDDQQTPTPAYLVMTAAQAAKAAAG
jgi:hypothetical protein